jgi:hypothetical protein
MFDERLTLVIWRTWARYSVCRNTEARKYSEENRGVNQIAVSNHSDLSRFSFTASGEGTSTALRHTSLQNTGHTYTRTSEPFCHQIPDSNIAPESNYGRGFWLFQSVSSGIRRNTSVGTYATLNTGCLKGIHKCKKLHWSARELRRTRKIIQSDSRLNVMTSGAYCTWCHSQSQKSYKHKIDS